MSEYSNSGISGMVQVDGVSINAATVCRELEAQLAEANAIRPLAQALLDSLNKYQYPTGKPAIPMPDVAPAANALSASLQGDKDDNQNRPTG